VGFAYSRFVDNLWEKNAHGMGTFRRTSYRYRILHPMGRVNEDALLYMNPATRIFSSALISLNVALAVHSARTTRLMRTMSICSSV
jgi:hypothetical protein